MRFESKKLIFDESHEPYHRAYELRKGDVIFLNDVAMNELCNNELIYMLKDVPLGNMRGIVTKCIWSKKKWWQFWKKKKWLGCNVEVL